MKDQDIEERAEAFLKDNRYLEVTKQAALGYGYIAGATEERERGKRFAVWLLKNNLTFVNDDIYNSFLAEEKELTN